MKKLLIFLVALAVLAGGITLYSYRHWLVRPDISRTGGTFLTYQVQTTPDYRPADLLAALGRRLDPTGAAGITLRAEGDDRVVIGVPFGPRHDDLVANVRTVTRPGRLEFRILANAVDDVAGLEAVRAALATPNGQAAARSATPDWPPPAPVPPEGATDFPVTLIDGGDRTRYEWVQVGPKLLGGAGLDRLGLEADPELNAQVRAALTTPRLVVVPRLWNAIVLPVGPIDAEPTFFALTRKPAPGQELTGDLLISASVASARNATDRSAVQFRLGPQGAGLMYDLTRRNRPASFDGPFRLLGVILDGKILTAPTLREALRADGQLTGEWTPAEAAGLAAVLRAGSLPVPLSPLPVDTTTTQPR